TECTRVSDVGFPPARRGNPAWLRPIVVISRRVSRPSAPLGKPTLYQLSYVREACIVAAFRRFALRAHARPTPRTRSRRSRRDSCVWGSLGTSRHVRWTLDAAD